MAEEESKEVLEASQEVTKVIPVTKENAMTVIINDNYYIVIDDYNHTLHEIEDTVSRDGEFKQVDRIVGYFGSVERCLRKVARRDLIRQEQLVDIDGYIRLLYGAMEDLDELLDKGFSPEEELEE